MMGRGELAATLVPRTVPGEPGAWIFIVSDMAIFTCLFGLILWLRAGQPAVFAAAQATLSQELGALNTIVLLVGSLLVVLATRSVAEASHVHAGRLLAGAVACGLAFAVIKGIEYGTALAAGHTMYTNDFFMLYFVVTGAHLLHVLVGTGALALLQRRIRRRLPGPRDQALFESGACYWHMVDLLWLILFPLFYLVS